LGIRGPKSKIEEQRLIDTRGGHGELTAKKWLDSIEKQKGSNLKFVTGGQTDRQSQLLTIIDS